MTSSSPDAVRAAATVELPRPVELRCGSWTRLGDAGILGDAVTERILSDLAAQAKAAGRAQGYAHGWAEGRRAADEQTRADIADAATRRVTEDQRRRHEHEQAINALTLAAERLQEAVDRACRLVEHQATVVAMRLAEEIVGRELAVARDPGADALRRALALGFEEPIVIVRLHPDDLHGAAPDLSPQGARLVADATLARGDALVETATTVIDARISTALERVREAFQ